MVYFSGQTKLKGGSALLSIFIALLFVLIFNFSSLAGALLYVDVDACKPTWGGCFNPLEDAEIYINGKFVGITDHAGRLWQDNLSAGTYTVKVEKKGWESQTKRFRATPNEYEEVKFTLKKPQPTQRKSSYSSNYEDRYEEHRPESRGNGGVNTEPEVYQSSEGESRPTKNLFWLFVKYIFIIIGIFATIWWIVRRYRERDDQDFGESSSPRQYERLVERLERNIRDLTGE